MKSQLYYLLYPLSLLGFWLIEYGALFFAENKNILFNSRSLITFINNISLNLIFIPKYGIYGAAFGTTLALILTGFIILGLKKNIKKAIELSFKFLKFIIFTRIYLSWE